MSGCAGTEVLGGSPYFDVGVGYQLDSHSDWYVRTQREWQCSDNFQGVFEIGLDYGDWEIGYRHQSWYTCGGPFNDRSELYQDAVEVNYRFGGREN